MSGGEKSGNSFEAALEAKLAKGFAAQNRERQRDAAAATATRAMQARAEQILPVRQAAAEAAAATMRADARKAAEMMRSFGYPLPVSAMLEEDSQIVDPSRKPFGYEVTRQRLFRAPVRYLFILMTR